MIFIYTVKTVYLESEKEDAKRLLLSLDLNYEDSIDETILILDGDKVIGTGSIDSKVIKMIGVDPNYQGENITSQILSELMKRLYQRETNKFFLYTEKKSKHIFEPFDFQLVSETDAICLYENGLNPLQAYYQNLSSTLPKKKGIRSSIVMNCNPMTNGHLYLIEKASKASTDVLLFLVEENRSIFDFEDRYKIVSKSICHLKNVHLIPSGPYIISAATFPSYFLKSNSEVSKAYMDLDVKIFSEKIMPLLEIDYRYVGEEPLDLMTQNYNQTLFNALHERLIIIPRIAYQGQTISASYVRSLAAQGHYDAIKMVVPNQTYQFLISKKGRALFHG